MLVSFDQEHVVFAMPIWQVATKVCFVFLMSRQKSVSVFVKSLFSFCAKVCKIEMTKMVKNTLFLILKGSTSFSGFRGFWETVKATQKAQAVHAKT